MLNDINATSQQLRPDVSAGFYGLHHFRSIAVLKRFVVFAMSLFFFAFVMATESNSGTRKSNTPEFGVDVTDSPTNDFPKVIFIDGMTFGDKQSWQAVESLANLLEMPVGRFSLKFNPTPGINVSDALAEKFLRNINKRWEEANTNGLVILFMAGNNQFLKALEVGKMYGRKMNNISVISIANETSIEERIAWFKESLETGNHPFQKFVSNGNLQRMLIDWKTSVR